MSETWRPVPSFPKYEASDEGRVRSIHGARPRLLALNTNAWGYLRFCAAIDGKRRTITVHLAVAEAFHGPRPEGMVTRHLDGDKMNNKPSNLCYGSHSENNKDTVTHGNHRKTSKTHCPSGHLYNEENTYRWESHRSCRVCNRLAVRRSKARRLSKKDAAEADR